jgi:hypothetical protein
MLETSRSILCIGLTSRATIADMTVVRAAAYVRISRDREGEALGVGRQE